MRHRNRETRERDSDGEPRGLNTRRRGELAVPRVTVIFEGLNFAHMGKCRDPGLRCPTARPLDDLERKLAGAQGGHHEPPPLIGRVGLIVAPAAKVEVRALRALDHMVNVECRQ